MDKAVKHMVKDLKALVAYPSVESEAKPGKPFGEACADALAFMLKRGEDMGFAARNFDGYAGHICWGEGEPVGVLCHLDVVPAGDGWVTDPFEAVEQNGRIYGRGVMDDKGPAIAVLYAMQALKEEGFTPKKQVRLILGCDEESGWRCMEHYSQQEKMPDTGFSPDGEFPVIFAEKGVLHLECIAPAGQAFRDKIFSFHGGTCSNMVPAFGEFIYRGNLELSDLEDGKIVHDGDFTTVTAKGINAHGSRPQDGKNALWRLFAALSGVVDDPSVRFIADKFCADFDGTALGIACSDEVSGPLTFNLGMCEFREGNLVLQLDIRYPVTYTQDDVLAKLNKALPESFRLEVVMHHRPLHVSKDSPLVASLMEAYRETTGRAEPPIAIGGGTFARMLPQGVAFGPMFSDQEDTVHKPNEYIPIDQLVTLVEIYKNAIKKLAQ